jgi:hypothetical protein
VEVSQRAGVGRPHGGLVDLGRGGGSEQSVLLQLQYAGPRGEGSSCEIDSLIGIRRLC